MKYRIQKVTNNLSDEVWYCVQQKSGWLSGWESVILGGYLNQEEAVKAVNKLNDKPIQSRKTIYETK